MHAVGQCRLSLSLLSRLFAIDDRLGRVVPIHDSGLEVCKFPTFLQTNCLYD